MTRLGRAVRNHHSTSRSIREINRAIDHAAVPTVRNELLTMAQVQGLLLR